ncbi:unnamed protein product, partial [marine sediment metagenome]
MPPTIQILAEKLLVSKGSEYFTIMAALRRHLERITDVEFAQQVDLIDNPAIMGQFFAAGLPLRRQSI